MKRTDDYRTKQRKALASYIMAQGDAHFSAAQIVEHFENIAQPIGRTTVFRYLNRLAGNGTLRKYTTDGVSGACYQLAQNNNSCLSHFHLKCEGCGELQHMECGEMAEIQRHFLSNHDFKVNALKTVLYGTCGNCLPGVER